MFHYFKGKISPGFVSLYSGRMTIRVVVGLVGLFLPIFLYELFNFNIKYVIYYFMTANIIYGLSVGWWARHLEKIGIRRSLRISIFWGAGFYLMLYFLDKGLTQMGAEFMYSSKIIYLLLLSLLFTTFYRLMFWVPYHTDLAKFTNKKNRAKQLSLIQATMTVIGAILPLFAGWVLSYYSYDVLFLIAIIIYFISLIPFSSLPETNEKYSWSYRQTWKEFFSKKRRKIVYAYMADGAQSVIYFIIWPVFIWKLLDGDYFEVGVLSSLIVAVTVVLQLIVGKFADSISKKKMLHYGTVLYSIGWIVKIFIVTAFEIFVASTYHNLARIFTRTPFDALNYEQAADEGHYVDEYTVIHEIAIQSGKVLMYIFSLVVVSFTTLEWTFILAAVASLAMNLLADDEVFEKGRFLG